jgi:predicted transcriptional regulator
MERKTTIQVDLSTKKRLEKLKIYKKETLNDVIDNLIEDSTELSETTKKEIEESMKAIDNGEFVTLDRVKKELGL